MDKEKCDKLIKVYLFQKAKQDNIIPLVKENFVDGKWTSLNETAKIVT